MAQTQRESSGAPVARQSALTIVVDVEASQMGPLRELLATIAKDPGENALVPFSRSKSTHFARWVLLESAPTKLLFESNHDGSQADYLAELIAIAPEGLRRIYERCVGFAASKSLEAYLSANTVDASAFYLGYPYRPVSEVLAALRVRSEVQRFVDAHRTTLSALPAAEAHARIRAHLLDTAIELPPPRNVRTLPLSFLTDALGAAFAKPFIPRVRAIALYAAILLLPPAGLLLTPLSPAYGAYLGLLGFLAAAIRVREGDDDKARNVDVRPTDTHVRQLMEREDFGAQNQLTHVATIKDGLLRTILLRGVLFGIDTLARITFNQGNLGGIPTIHFARWFIVDNRLIFFSNYDGSWDSYLGDFVDQAASGLTGIWTNTVDFPKTTLLFGAGARDIERFKDWTRKGQVLTQVWYTAYPTSTVRNIRDAIALSASLAEPMDDAEAEKWIARL
jgi:hypothetical protein